MSSSSSSSNNNDHDWHGAILEELHSTHHLALSFFAVPLLAPASSLHPTRKRKRVCVCVLCRASTPLVRHA